MSTERGDRRPADLIGLIDRTGVLDIADRLFGRAGIVTYHGVTRDAFLPAAHVTEARLVEHLSWLREKYRVIPLREFVARHQSRRTLNGCVAVTFDDAYEGVLRLGVPILERLGIPATVFVVTGFVNDAQRYWWDRLEWIRLHAKSSGHREILRVLTGSTDLKDDEMLRSMLTVSGGCLSPQADAMITRLEQEVGRVPIRPLTETELERLAGCDLVDLACHTTNHRALPTLSTDEQCREIQESYSWLRERYPGTEPYLAYPYGWYDSTSIEAARRAGMRAAFTTQGYAVGPWCSVLSMPRIIVGDPHEVRSVRLRLSRAAIPAVVWRKGWHARIPAEAKP